MRTLLRQIALGGGILLLLISPVFLLVPDSFVVEQVTIEQLEADDTAAGDQVRVTGGRLYWRTAVRSYDANLAGEERTTNAYFVPLVSERLARRFDAEFRAGRNPPLRECRVFVKLPVELVEAQFPDVIDGRGLDDSPTFETTGSKNPGRALPLHVKQHLNKEVPQLSFDRIAYIEHGNTFEAWQGTLVFVIFGGLLLATGLHLRKPPTTSEVAAATA